MKIAVDGRGYGTAARVLRAGNHAAADQHGQLVAGLATYGGMAGDDATSVEFARSYDVAAQAAVDGLADVVDAFATLAQLTRQSLRNHQHADLAAVFGHPAPDPASLDFEPGTVSVGACAVPSALGSNPVDLPPLWEHVVDRLEGYAWPDADTGRLRSAAALWRTSAEYVERLVPSCESAVAQLQTQRSPEVPLALQALHDLGTTLSGLAVEMLAIGDACEQYAAAVEEHRAVVRGILTDLAFEAGLTVVAGTVLSVVTVGGAAVAGGAIAGWRIVAAARKVLVTLRALRDLHRARAVARLTEVVDRIGPLRRVLLRLKRGRRLKALERTVKARGAPGTPLDPATRPPQAGANWIGRVADNGKGEVWQRPGAPRNHDMIRIQDPTPRYPDGSVRFYNSEGQPIDLNGKPTGRHETHVAINPDGTFPIPKGWKP